MAHAYLIACGKCHFAELWWSHSNVKERFKDIENHQDDLSVSECGGILELMDIEIQS